jgi:cell wall-associated NlpC family hydrolase
LTVPAGATIPGGAPAAAEPTAAAPTAAVSSPASSTAAVPTTSYTVLRGDALSTIAYRHGVTLKALLTTNKLQVTSTIMPGRVLQIPPATKPIPAVPSSQAAPTATVASTPTSPTQVLVDYLEAQVGKPYKFFTAGPETFDCSGLVVAGYRQIGIELTHQSGSLAKAGRAVDPAAEAIVAGDIIVLSSPTDPSTIAHVGVAISGTSWIQAVGPGVPARVGPLPTSRIVAVRRVIGQ